MTNYQNERYMKRYRKSQREARMNFKRWTPFEDKMIQDEDRPDDVTLAKMLGRSIAAIQVRRSNVLNGKISGLAAGF